MIKNIYMILLLCVTFLINSAWSSETVNVQQWQKHMKELSSTIVNAFPFLYSKTEFKAPQNRKIILDHLQKLSKTSHTLPIKSGEMLVGAGPLLAASRNEMSEDIDRATKLFKENRFVEAQKMVHRSVYNCFACHAAHQVGPAFPNTNQEVMRLATPFTSEKAIVFGAMREFGGALDFIERNGFSSIAIKSPHSDDLVKIFLVISVRTLSQFDRALTFVSKLTAKQAKSSPAKATLAAWTSDLQAWKVLFQKGDRLEMQKWIASRRAAQPTEPAKSLVLDIIESWHLHTLAAQNEVASGKAEKYLRLAQLYRAIDLQPLNGLVKIYADACLIQTPAKTTAEACVSLAGR